MAEMGVIGEGKNLKYNHVEPIDLDTIPIEEREQALKEFAEGSIGLEICLRTMWKYGLKTLACCAEEESDYSEAYIAMAEGVDVFSFLSPDLLASDMIALENDDRQVIRFGGPREIREQTMQQVAKDITNGKKNNTDLVQNKIGKSLNESWLKESRIYHMRKAGLTEEEIEEWEKWSRKLHQILATGTNDETEATLEDNTGIRKK